MQRFNLTTLETNVGSHKEALIGKQEDRKWLIVVQPIKNSVAWSRETLQLLCTTNSGVDSRCSSDIAHNRVGKIIYLNLE